MTMARPFALQLPEATLRRIQRTANAVCCFILLAGLMLTALTAAAAAQLAFPPVTGSVTITWEDIATSKCTPPMFRDDEGNCQCPDPLEKKGNRCVKVVAEIFCPKGSTKVGNKCIRCPSEQYLLNGKCTCPEPLIKKGNRCEEEKVAVICKLPEIKLGGLCVLPPCPANMGRDGGKCQCPSGTEWNEGESICNTPSIAVTCLPPNYINDEGRCAKLVISAPPPQIIITPSELPGGEEGNDEYPNIQLVANGGTGPHTFTVTTGQLPPGLSLAPDGLLDGVPEKAGAYGFTVTTTDAGQFTGIWNYSITITKAEEQEIASVPGCPEGTVRIGVDCIPVGGTQTCNDDEDMRNGRCVKRPQVTVLFPAEVQTELKRVGCLTGRVDGIWGGGSRAGLSKFYQRARTSTRNLEPTKSAWAATRSKPRNFCPRVVVKKPKKKKTTKTKTKTVSTSNSCKRRSCGRGGYWKNCKCNCAGNLKWNGRKCVQKGPSVTDVLINVIGACLNSKKCSGGGDTSTQRGGGGRGGGRKCYTNDDGSRYCE